MTGWQSAVIGWQSALRRQSAGWQSAVRRQSAGWQSAVLAAFPNLLATTHCVPPVHFNRQPYSVSCVAGQTCAVPSYPQQEGVNPEDQDVGQGKSHVEVPCLPITSPHLRKPPCKSKKKGRPKPLPVNEPLFTEDGVPHDNPVTVFEHDFRDDFAQQHVLRHLLELGRQQGQVMFILSQFLFSDYLSQPCWAATAHLNKPGSIGSEFPGYRNGEFDILVIHRHYGLLLGELKSVGINHGDINRSQDQADADVTKRVKRAVHQLNRSGTMLSHLVSDVASDVVPGLQLTIRKTIFLPYVTSNQLDRVLARDPELQSEVCECLEVADRREAVQLCVCADLLSPPETFWDVTPDVMARFTSWWQRRMSATNTQLDDWLYLEIVSRFVGPASSKTVLCPFSPSREVKLPWHGVQELGWRLARLVLTPRQMDLLYRAPNRVCLTGPPGTGKTVVLVMMALQWLLQQRDVHVVSVFYKSLAASQLVKSQLRLMVQKTKAAGQAVGTVHFHQYNFWDREGDVDRAIADLVSAGGRHTPLFVVMDEAWFGYRGLSDCYDWLVSEVTRQRPDVNIWAADVGRICIPPQLTVEPLTSPLRYCGVVLREIQAGLQLYSTVHTYNMAGLPLVADGPDVIHLRHEGPGHEADWPVLCYQCGQDVAHVLLQHLKVGCDASQEGLQTPRCPQPLHFRDVFVLTRSCELNDVIHDEQGHVTTQASGFVQGLRDANVRVCVLSGNIHDPVRWERELADVAVGATDWVTVAHLGAANGLERKVVVWLPGKMEGDDQHYTPDAIEALDRLASVSRCTTQLIVVDLPTGVATRPARPLQRSQCVVS